MPIEKPGNERSERAALREAEKLRTKLVADADALRVARTKATVGALLDRWLARRVSWPWRRWHAGIRIAWLVALTVWRFGRIEEKWSSGGLRTDSTSGSAVAGS